MVLKKWLILIFCLSATTLSARVSYEIQGTLGNPKALKLNTKMLRFVATHPKTSEYLYQGAQELEGVLEKYISQTQKLIDTYPNERASSLAEKRVTKIQYFIDNREDLTKAGLFLFLGIYDQKAYKDPKTWKQLIKTQDAILSHYIDRAQTKADFEAYRSAKNEGKDPLNTLELNLMGKIKAFCQKSADPFFHSVLLPRIQECQTREDVLKHFISVRDETAIDDDCGELFSEAEEEYQELNEEIWKELKNTVGKYFSRKETSDQIIEIFSDTFDIPNYP